jgi:hypothetical protein
MLKWNFIVLLSLLTHYVTLVGVSGDNPEALSFTVFVKISKANKARLSIEKSRHLSITPDRFEDTFSVEGTNLRVDLSGIEDMDATTLRIPAKTVVFFLTEHQEFPPSAEEEEANFINISDDEE